MDGYILISRHWDRLLLTMTSIESWYNWNLTNYCRRSLNFSKLFLPAGSSSADEKPKAAFFFYSAGILGGCGAVWDVRGVFGVWLGQVLSQACLTLWKLEFQLCVTLLVILEVQLPSLTTPPGVALLKNRGQVVLWEVGCAPGEVHLRHLKFDFPECLVNEANEN